MTIAPVSSVTQAFVDELNANFTALTNPAPDNFATWLQAKVNAGTSAYWVWGNVNVPAPMLITITQNLICFTLDLGGAIIGNGFNDNTSDLLKFFVPDTASNVNVQGFTIQNGTLNGSTGFFRGVNNVLTLSCPLAQSGIYGFQTNNLDLIGGHGDGGLFYGNVFEGYLRFRVVENNDGNGLNFRNPTQGGGAGVISSMHVVGGDFRFNGLRGIFTSSDTAFQEPPQCPYVTSADFIGNGAEGMYSPAGYYCTDSHFENNCGTTGNSGLNTEYSASYTERCVATASNGKQLYLATLQSGGGHIFRSSLNLTGKALNLPNTGNVLIDPIVWTGSLASYINGVGGWSVYVPTTTTSTV